MSGPMQRLADAPADVAISDTIRLGDGFRRYERFTLTLRHPPDEAGHEVQQSQVRDVVRGGRVVGVLAYDPARGEVVLIRQFRLPAHLATGNGEMVEIVAGRVEEGEDAREAAVRECLEEIGVAPSHLVPLFEFLPTPGLTDECATLFLGLVDAGSLPDRAGLAGESEVTHPFAVSVEEALAALDFGRIANGYLIIALQWLALNRARIPQLTGASA